MTDSDATVQALRQCLDLIEGGEAPEKALARFPEQREALAPLVETALGLRALEMPAPPPAVLAGLSEALDLGASVGDAARAPAGEASWWSRLALRLGLGSGATGSGGSPAWARAAALVAVAMLLLTTLALAAGRSAPGDLLYPLGQALDGIVPLGPDGEPVEVTQSTEPPATSASESKPPTPIAREVVTRSGESVGVVAEMAETQSAQETGSALAAAAPAATEAPQPSEPAEPAPVVVVVVPTDAVAPPSPTTAAPVPAPPTQRHIDDPRPTAPPPSATSEPPPPASETAGPPTAETAEPTPGPTSPTQPVVISVLVVDLDGAAMADASVQGWNDDADVEAACTTNDGGACDLRFDEPGRFVVLVGLASPPVSRWYDGKTSRDQADRVALDTPGDIQSILVVLPVGSEPLPTDADGAAATAVPTVLAQPSAQPPTPTVESSQAQVRDPAGPRTTRRMPEPRR